MLKFEKIARLLGLLLLSISLFVSKGCGFNLFSSFSQKDDNKSKLENAKVHLDNKEYTEADTILSALVADPSSDSNTARVYLAAAKIGIAGMDIWTIISSLINTVSSTNPNYTDLFEEATNTLLGIGETRTAKLATLADAIELLLDVPDPATASRAQNTACFLGSMLVAAELVDAQNKVDNLNSALSGLSSLNSNGVCDSLESLISAFDALASTAGNFSLVSRVVASCPILSQGEASETLSGITSQMDALIAKADKGCDSVPTCSLPAALCSVLTPTCVQDALGVGGDSAVADDGILATCELALECTIKGGCF